eukprot:INCI4153.3.p1 GENE.INCI4153.3~~INCI4153.3.p1  ORF type:complete len:290 (-),score=79.28 INCI4153.3:855-1625(-)
MYGGPGKKRKRKGNPGVYIQGLPLHLKEVELRIALQRMCERVAGPVRRIKVYHVPDQPGVVKGDALVLFEMPKDAVAAVEKLNGEQLQAGFPMTVTRAQFDASARGNSQGTSDDQNIAEEQRATAVTSAPAAPGPNPFGGKRGNGYTPLQPQLQHVQPGGESFAPPAAFAAQAFAQQQQLAAAAAAQAAPITAQAISGTVLLYNVFDPTRELNPYLSHKSELKGIEKEMYDEVRRFGVVKGFDILQDGSVLVVYVC